MGSSLLSVSGNLKPRWVQEAFPVVQSYSGLMRDIKGHDKRIEMEFRS